MKPYKKPILKDQSANLSKSWFVEFYFWSDQDQKLKRKRLTSIPGLCSHNFAKTKKDRYSEFKVIVDSIEFLLSNGWTPEGKIPTDRIIKTKKPDFLIADEAISRQLG